MRVRCTQQPHDNSSNPELWLQAGQAPGISLPAFKPLGRPAQPLGLSVWGPMAELAMAALEGVK